MEDFDELFLDELDEHHNNSESVDALITVNQSSNCDTFSYSCVNQTSKPPYNCSCGNLFKTFKTRQIFKRHMHSEHTIVIPDKIMKSTKRKAEGIVADEHKFKK